MIEQPRIEIVADNDWLEKFAKEYLQQLYDERLKPEWLTIPDLEEITRHERKWIMEHIINDPYVQKKWNRKRRLAETLSQNGLLMQKK